MATFKRAGREMPVTVHRLVEQLPQPSQLRVAPEERPFRCGEIMSSRCGLPRGVSAIAQPLVGGPHCLRPPKQFLIEPLRFRFGLRPQLALQHLYAYLVLLKRRPPPALPGIEAHERAVDGLLQGIESQKSYGRLDRRLRRCALRLVGQQPG